MNNAFIRAGRICFAGALACAATAGAAVANQVQVRIEGSLLVIAGDTAANQIVVAQNAAGDVVVTGQAGTLVNGAASARFPRVALNAAEILMGSGNDVVTLRNLRIANDLFVNLGPGDDRLVAPSAAPLAIGANATVEAAEGNDVVRIEAAAVASDLKIDGGLGILNCTLSATVVGYGIQMVADDANDIMTITNTIAGDVISVETKGGSDRVTMTNVDARLMGISTDANGLVGLDSVNLMRITTTEDLGIFTGPGNDVVLLMDVVVNKSLSVSVDEGNDRVAGTSVTVVYDGVFEGGAGTDRFEDYGISAGVKKDIKEFEVLLP